MFSSNVFNLKKIQKVRIIVSQNVDFLFFWRLQWSFLLHISQLKIKSKPYIFEEKWKNLVHKVQTLLKDPKWITSRKKADCYIVPIIFQNKSWSLSIYWPPHFIFFLVLILMLCKVDYMFLITSVQFPDATEQNAVTLP